MFTSERQKTLARAVFAVYLFLLCWLVLFKLSVHPGELVGVRGVNLVPFAQSLRVNGEPAVWEIGYNALVFVPLGVYLQLFWPQKPMVWKWGAGALLSVLFEVLQYAFAIGMSDITDVLANALGCLLGLAGCRLFGRLLGDRLVPAVNGIGIAVEAAALLLTAALLLAN